MSDIPQLDAEQTVDRMIEEGAIVIDSSQTALALFVTMDGHVNVRTVYDGATTAKILRQLADAAETRS